MSLIPGNSRAARKQTEHTLVDLRYTIVHYVEEVGEERGVFGWGGISRSRERVNNIPARIYLPAPYPDERGKAPSNAVEPGYSDSPEKHRGCKRLSAPG